MVDTRDLKSLDHNGRGGSSPPFGTIFIIMSRNNATFVTKQQLKFLKEMDKWLSNEPWQSEFEIKTAMEVRTLIDKIEKRGYYYEDEADLLNLMREEYIKHKKIKFVYTYKKYEI